MAVENAKSYLIQMIFGTLWFFWVTDYEFKPKLQKFKMANLISLSKMQNLLDWDEIWYSGVFGVADYESKLNIQKFEMVSESHLAD